MRVRLAGKIGFCFGVKRAIDMAEAALKKDKPIYSLGSIIHNKQVVDVLSKKGLKAVDEAGKINCGVCLISSHGISPLIASKIRKKGVKIIDTTCPFVRKAQLIARNQSGGGHDVIIVGDAGHPEVKALKDFAKGRVMVVKDAVDAKRLRLDRRAKYIVIAQTTQSTKNLLSAVKALKDKKAGVLKVFNTICRDAEERQKAARALAREVDAMLVVGGRHSANTNRLLEVCKGILANSHLIETEKDLKKSWFKDAKVVGVTSGASTPDWVVERVVRSVKRKE